MWQHGKPCQWWAHQTGTPRGSVRAGRVADRLVVLVTPGNAGRGKEPDFGNSMERRQGMATGLNLTGLQGVRKLRNILHVKAKKEPECRFHALVDKVWRMDFLTVAYIQVRRNGGVCGVDGETFADIESNGLETWLGELSDTTRRLRRWLCRKHKVRVREYVRFSNQNFI